MKNETRLLLTRHRACRRRRWAFPPTRSASGLTRHLPVLQRSFALCAFASEESWLGGIQRHPDTPYNRRFAGRDDTSALPRTECNRHQVGRVHKPRSRCSSDRFVWRGRVRTTSAHRLYKICRRNAHDRECRLRLRRRARRTVDGGTLPCHRSLCTNNGCAREDTSTTLGKKRSSCGAGHEGRRPVLYMVGIRSAVARVRRCPVPRSPRRRIAFDRGCTFASHRTWSSRTLGARECTCGGVKRSGRFRKRFGLVGVWVELPRFFARPRCRRTHAATMVPSCAAATSSLRTRHKPLENLSSHSHHDAPELYNDSSPPFLVLVVEHRRLAQWRQSVRTRPCVQMPRPTQTRHVWRHRPCAQNVALHSTQRERRRPCRHTDEPLHGTHVCRYRPCSHTPLPPQSLQPYRE